MTHIQTIIDSDAGDGNNANANEAADDAEAAKNSAEQAFQNV